MIVELNVHNITDLKSNSLIYFDVEKKIFKAISVDHFKNNIEDGLKKLGLEVENQGLFIKDIAKLNLANELSKIEKRIFKLSCIEAYELLVSDIVNGEIEDPENLTEIQMWCFNPNFKTTPKILEPYLIHVLDLESEDENNGNVE